MNNRVMKLIEEGQKLKIEISDEQSKKLIDYMDRILEINQQINLTRIIDEDDFIKLHILDSLTLLQYIENPIISILDVGTGGGFPGIPLAIMLENSHITLMDATKKKLKVIETIAKDLGITNIKTLHGRAEEFGKDIGYRESYDVVVSRAVANLTLLSEYCLPLVKVGGVFLSMKGKDYKNEIIEAEKPIARLGGEITKFEEALLLQSEWVHAIIEIKKIKNTPNAFPRINGKIKREEFPI